MVHDLFDAVFHEKRRIHDLAGDAIVFVYAP
jgi:hypothetical protein